MKALILAAGMGSRLAPFTDVLPKPLVPFFGIPSLVYAIDKCISDGLDICINTHHLPTHIEDFVNTHYKNAGIHLSFEKELLGTGGAVANIRDWLAGDSLLIYNADIISDCSLAELIKTHEKRGKVATMTMIDHIADSTPVYNLDQEVVQVGGPDNAPEGALAHSFSGIHILSPDFIKALPESHFFSVIDTYRDFIRDNSYPAVYEHNGFWADIGTPSALWKAHSDVIGDSTKIGSLRIKDLREQLSKDPLVFDQSNGSAYTRRAIDQSGPIQISQSFVETRQPIQNSQLERCLVVDTDADRLGQWDVLRDVVVMGSRLRGF